MIRKITVLDSSPLIILAKLDKFYLLKEFFGKIYIPEAVYNEVVIKGKNRAGEKETKEAIGDWIEKVKVKDQLAVETLLVNLHRGEAEAIVLARELLATRVITDDYEAVIMAKSLELNTTGTLDILLSGYKLGFIKDLKAILDELREKGFYLDDEVYEKILNSQI